MDKLKVKIDITEAWRALDRLEAALEHGDQRGAGNALYNIRQRLYMLQNELGIVRDLADLKSEIELSRAALPADGLQPAGAMACGAIAATPAGRQPTGSAKCRRPACLACLRGLIDRTKPGRGDRRGARVQFTNHGGNHDNPDICS